MLLAQGLGPPLLVALPIAVAMVITTAVAMNLVASRLWKTKQPKYRWIIFITLTACFWYFLGVPRYVSSEAVTSIARKGVPATRVAEILGPPHFISTNRDETVWYYETGLLGTRTLGVTINTDDQKVIDWFVQ